LILDSRYSLTEIAPNPKSSIENLPMRFEFATAARIIFGPGTLGEIGPAAAETGRHALVVTGRHPARADRLLDLLRASKVATTLCAMGGEPTIADVTAATSNARAAGCDFIIGFGGGSVLDGAKAIAALLTNPGDPLNDLEVIGRGQPLTQPAAPCLAIPTTAGTGSEVTRNAVLCSPAHGVKVSLRSPHMLPRVALVDPGLTCDLPPALTAATGLDALTQLIEPYVCNRANPMTDALCIDGIRRAARSLRAATENGRDARAREDMALASLLGGLALANAGLGAVHGFAAPIGGRFNAPHGAVCAILLPHVMAANLQALRARAPGHDALRRFDEVARLLTGQPHATAEEGIAWVRELVHHLAIPALGAYKLGTADVAPLVEASTKASSMKANPVALTPAELTDILMRAL
jgi:alcohol dehydrogenase class IV